MFMFLWRRTVIFTAEFTVCLRSRRPRLLNLNVPHLNRHPLPQCELITTIHVTIPDAKNAVSAASISSSGLRGCDTRVLNDSDLSTFQVLAWYVSVAAQIPATAGISFDFLWHEGYPLCATTVCFALFQTKNSNTSKSAAIPPHPSETRQALASPAEVRDNIPHPHVAVQGRDSILLFYIQCVCAAYPLFTVTRPTYFLVATVLLMLADLVPAFGTFSGYFHP